MSKKYLPSKNTIKFGLISTSLCFSLFTSCAVSAKNVTTEEVSTEKVTAESKAIENKPNDVTKNSLVKTKIQITQGSPADTVRIFYKNLREKRFREAMMMTNLRPAIEDLSDAEMAELNTDFEPLAQQVPEDIAINGETIAGNSATVMAKMPDETGKLELNEIELRREKDEWIILTADANAEAKAKKQGKTYFFTLRIEVHHIEAQNMMERIAKAQTVYALQNGGTFGDIPTLVGSGFLPEDAQNSVSTGYRFKVTPSEDKKKYVATAEPEVYGKSGKLSFLLVSDGADKQARLKSEDNKGLPLKK